MELERNPGPLLGMCACDADLFRRVWERVGADARPDCPIVPGPAPDILTPAQPMEPAMAGRTAAPPEGMAGPVPPAAVPAPAAAGEWEVPVPAGPQPPVQPQPAPPLPAQPEPPAPSGPEEAGPTAAPRQGARGDDFPPEDDLPCLGRASAPQGGPLQGYIRQELEGWQLYRHLSRRVNGPNARTLAALASEKHRCARRLAAAYFLISGVRFWPTDQLAVPQLSAWLGVLRERFSAEQRQEHRYRAAACGTNDPCLAELYADLAEESASHAAVLRAILESAL